MKKFLSVFPHISLVISVAFMVFLIIDIFNPSMNFADSEQARYLLWLLVISTSVTCIFCIYLDRKNEK